MDVIFNKHFYPSFMQFNSNDFELTVFETKVKGNGNYNTPGYIECLHQKTTLMLNTVKENIGRPIVWTDIDIRFISKIDLSNYNNDFTVLRESLYNVNYNPAFCRINCNETMVNFFTKLLESCKYHGKHDMDILNDYPDTIPNVGIDVFDFRYKQFTNIPRIHIICDYCHNNQGAYTCTHQLINLDHINESNTILFHSNYTMPNNTKSSMDLKLEQLDYFIK